MKKIEIQGKRNQDKMKQMDEPDAVIERKMPKNRVVLPDGFYATDQSLGRDVLKAHIANISIGTILGQGQSAVMVRGIANTDMGYYCREICQVTYKESMCRKQWTLDRIDNNYGHNDTNVVIACLDCNLKRGTMDSERFRQGKQFTFRKVE